MTDRQTVLVEITGPDRPGISAGVLRVLDKVDALVLDIEQVVIRRHLTLGLLVDVAPDHDALKELLLFGWKHELKVDFDIIEEPPSEPHPGHVVTLLGPELSPAELLAAAEAIAEGGGNIDRINRLSKYPVMSYELTVLGGDPATIRTNLLAAAALHPGLDVALQREGIARRAKRLVVLDVDSTLIQDEVIDLLAQEAGCATEVAELTARAMAGELDFTDSLRRRVRLLAGLDLAGVERARRRLQLTPGARTFIRTLHRLGFTTAIVSGGFTAFTDALAAELDIGYCRANELEIRDGALTGEVIGQVVDRATKAQFLHEVAADIGVAVEQVVAVGDGANDVDMLNAAGLGIAFNAKPVVRDAADTALRVPYLDAILFVLGVSREEVEAADAADPAVPRTEPPPVR
ncbi:MAG: phosphoserine phosphatase SerB [Acidimicrobiia bacterium]|nr:phosphoserine phosphatase SerB [Acidimicrobiia bacterium]